MTPCPPPHHRLRCSQNIPALEILRVDLALEVIRLAIALAMGVLRFTRALEARRLAIAIAIGLEVVRVTLALEVIRLAIALGEHEGSPRFQRKSVEVSVIARGMLSALA